MSNVAHNQSVKGQLLIVDDDSVFRERLVRACNERGYCAQGADCAESALKIAARDCPDRIVLDLKMPGMSGLELIPYLRKIVPAAHIVVLTGFGSITTAMQAVRLGAVNYLSKPVDTDSILRAFEDNEDADRGVPVGVPSLERVEWEHIQRVLNDFGGNITKAAKALKMHRRSLQRKILKVPPK